MRSPHLVEGNRAKLHIHALTTRARYVVLRQHCEHDNTIEVYMTGSIPGGSESADTSGCLQKRYPLSAEGTIVSCGSTQH